MRREHSPEGDDPALFLSDRKKRLGVRAVQAMVKKYAELAGISRTVSPHLLRHSSATLLMEVGTPLRVVQEICGHASVETTQRSDPADRSHTVRLSPHWVPVGLSFADYFPTIGDFTTFSAISVSVMGPEDFDALLTLIILSASSVPQFVLRETDLGPFTLVYLVSPVSSDFERRVEVARAMAVAFGQPIENAAFLPPTIPVPGTMYFDEKGRAISEVDMWVGNMPHTYTFEELAEDFLGS